MDQLSGALSWLRSNRTPRLWQELLLCALGWWLYGVVRNAVPEHREAALQRAQNVHSFERGLHVDPELAVNRFFTEHRWLVVPANYYYATLHFVVTLGVLVWLFRSHQAQYRAARSALFFTCLVALIGFYLTPLAPPRMLSSDGFVDTVVAFHTWGSFASGNVASASNQYAAMPSLHMGWALWCGIAIFTLARHRLVRLVGALYPLATLVVIVATANHFVLDAVGGLLALSLGMAIQVAWSGHRSFAGAPPLSSTA